MWPDDIYYDFLAARGFTLVYRGASFARFVNDRWLYAHFTGAARGYVESTRYHPQLWFASLEELEEAIIYESLREDLP